jgi:uncharacterized protein (DUF305 family)
MTQLFLRQPSPSAGAVFMARPVATAAVALLLLACAATPEAPPVVQAGAPGEASRPITDAAAGRVTAPQHVQADADFMRAMIVHHLQAVEMTALVEQRTQRADIRLLARRIEASQEDELASMRRWLTERGEAVPDEHAHHAHGAHEGMPGMLSPAEIARLRAASGGEFDRLFLEYMIRHHEGALVMVADLLAIDGAGQEAEIFQFASHVDADQRVEIDRMRRMLEAGS